MNRFNSRNERHDGSVLALDGEEQDDPAKGGENHLKAYEIIVILDPALTEEEVEGQVSEIKELVAKGNGEVQEVQRWGKRRLAYLVKKRREGYYAFFRLTIDPKTLASMEKNFKISERILKY